MRKLALFMFSHRTLALLRWDLHFLRIRAANFLLGRSRSIRERVACAARPVYLNLGSGPRGRADPNWINVDGFPDVNVHHLMDFTRPFPFEGESLNGVFCEHVLEHFSRQDGEGVAREAFRCLRPGGVMRIVVPDAERIMKAYFDDPGKLLEGRGPSTTPVEAVNDYFRQRYEHQFLYDWEAMKAMLAGAGFGKVQRCSMGRGDLCPDIILDDPKYESESLYVEAQR
jgi:predicted SAM-dependent methyltransferase